MFYDDPRCTKLADRIYIYKNIIQVYLSTLLALLGVKPNLLIKNTLPKLMNGKTEQ